MQLREHRGRHGTSPPRPEAPDADEEVDRDDQPTDSHVRVDHLRRLLAGPRPPTTPGCATSCSLPVTPPRPSSYPPTTAAPSTSPTSTDTRVVIYFYPKDDTPGLYEAGMRAARRPGRLRRGRRDRARRLARLARVAREVPRQVRSRLPAARRRGPRDRRGVRRLGREDQLRQDVDGHHPQRVRDRRGWPHRAGAVQRQARGDGTRARSPRWPPAGRSRCRRSTACGCSTSHASWRVPTAR